MSRKIVTVRHGERVDFTFTDDWLNRCFDKEGKYTRQNLNQPESVPERSGSPQTFLRDSPLTEVGLVQGKLVGKGLAAENILSVEKGFVLVVSPSLRCIQTATQLLKGMGLEGEEHSLKVEPGLFEWTKWYVGCTPHWMTIDELKRAGFNIDESYQPFMSLEELKDGEGIEAYYERSYRLMLHLLEQNNGKDLLLVAHGSSLDTNSRQLIMGPASRRTEPEMMSVLRKIPYCATAVMEQDEATRKWSFAHVPKLQIVHDSEKGFFDAIQTLCGGGGPSSPTPSAPQQLHK